MYATDTYTQIHRYTDTQIHRYTDIQIYRYTDIQIYRYTDRCHRYRESHWISTEVSMKVDYAAQNEHMLCNKHN